MDNVALSAFMLCNNLLTKWANLPTTVINPMLASVGAMLATHAPHPRMQKLNEELQEVYDFAQSEAMRRIRAASEDLRLEAFTDSSGEEDAG